MGIQIVLKSHSIHRYNINGVTEAVNIYWNQTWYVNTDFNINTFNIF